MNPSPSRGSRPCYTCSMAISFGKTDPLIRLAAGLIILLAGGFLLIQGKMVFAPIALAFLFSMMLYPAVTKLESLKWPRGVAIISMLLAFLISVASILVALTLIFRRFLRNIPALETQFQANIESFRGFIDTTLGLGSGAANAVSNQLTLSELFSADLLGRVAGSTASLAITATLTVVFTFFMLYYRDRFKTYIHSLFNKKRHPALHAIFDQVDDVAPRYLLGIITVVAILAVLNSIGFALIGVQSPIVMGVVAAILNLIPFVGTIFGFGIVFLFTVATQSINVALGVLIMFVVVQFLDNNILTPNITASKIKLNPLFAIISILIGNLVWGVLGMFVALPFLAMIKILFDNTKSLQPLGKLLGVADRHDAAEADN